MTSQLAWLDFSEEEQRRAREIVQLFSQPESRDELGIGVIRDAFSNALFPGVSVVQTRARYLLFVPWLFLLGRQRGYRGPQLAQWVERNERRLIEVLRKGGALRGLIGRQAGARVKILPSTIYWSALQRYQILRVQGGIEAVVEAESGSSVVEAMLTEQAERAAFVWDPVIATWPQGFPSLEHLNFRLSEPESSWLGERISLACDGTLLAWLIARHLVPGETLGAWDEPWHDELPPDLRRIVDHGRLFSLVINGAAVVYNLLLADKCAALKIGRGLLDIEDYETMLAEWQDEVNALRPAINAWDVGDFWAFVDTNAAQQIGAVRRFVDDWLRLVRDGALSGERLARASELVAARERTQKRGQSRLINERLLRQWGGQSGTGRLTYRWEQVRTLLQDLNGVDIDA